MKLQKQQLSPSLQVTDVFGTEHHIPQGGKVILSFFREASCPFCNFRLYELTHHFDEIAHENVKVVCIFASTEDEVRRFLMRRPRPMIMVADPDQTQYQRFGVQQATEPQRWLAMFKRLWSLIRGNVMLIGAQGPRSKDSHILPADFLINDRGEIEQVYYGNDIGDHVPLEVLKQWSHV